MERRAGNYAANQFECPYCFKHWCTRGKPDFYTEARLIPNDGPKQQTLLGEPIPYYIEIQCGYCFKWFWFHGTETFSQHINEPPYGLVRAVVGP